MIDEKYTFEGLKVMDDVGREGSLREIEGLFEERGKKMIEDLKTLGHGLWSHGFDEDGGEIWGWNYMEEKSPRGLYLVFGKNEVKVDWLG